MLIQIFWCLCLLFSEEETCYICDGVFTKGEEYQRHVDECLAEARRQQERLEEGPKARRGRATRSRPIRDTEDGKEKHW